MGAPLAIGAVGLALAGMQMQYQIAGAEAQTEAVKAQNELALHLQADQALDARRDLETSETEAVSDRVRQANSEIAQTRVLAGELGASDSSTAAMLNEIAFIEGVDIGRIRGSADQQREAITSGLEASALEAAQGQIVAQNNEAISTAAAQANFLGAGLQIATTTGVNIYEQNAARNIR